MNNYKKRKQKYLLALPFIFVFIEMINLYRWRGADSLMIILWCVSFLITLWFSLPFYMLKEIIDKSGIEGGTLSKVIKVKVLFSFVLVCVIFTISFGLNDIYALFLSIAGMFVSMVIFSVVARRSAQGFEGLLYANAPETYSKKVVRFFVGEIDGKRNEVSGDDNINPATGLPMMGAGYDSHGNAFGTSGSYSLSDKESDYNL